MVKKSARRTDSTTVCVAAKAGAAREATAPRIKNFLMGISNKFRCDQVRSVEATPGKMLQQFAVGRFHPVVIAFATGNCLQGL